MIAVRLKSKSFMDTVAPIKIMGVSAASGLICYGMLLACGIWSNFGALDIVFYFAGIFYGLCLGLAMPVNQTVAVRNTPDERWGAANALYLLATDIGIGTASVIWGVINDSVRIHDHHLLRDGLHSGIADRRTRLLPARQSVGEAFPARGQGLQGLSRPSRHPTPWSHCSTPVEPAPSPTAHMRLKSRTLSAPLIFLAFQRNVSKKNKIGRAAKPNITQSASAQCKSPDEGDTQAFALRKQVAS